MTEKFFEFNLQRFDLPETPTIGAADNNVVVKGTDTQKGEPPTITVQESDTATSRAIAIALLPEAGATQSLDDVTYTYAGNFDWTFQSTTSQSATSDVVNQIINQNYTPQNGDSQSLDDVTYTFSDGNWTFESTTITTETATEDVVDQILAANYSPTTGDSYELDGTTYTFDGENWTYESTTTTTETATEDVVDQIVAENYSPVDDDAQEFNAITYTYTDGSWTFESTTTTTETATEDIAAQILAENYSPDDGDTQTLDDIDYTFSDGNWTFESALVADNQDDLTAAYQNEQAPLEADTQYIDENGTTYTFDGDNWTQESAATEDIANQILAENYAPAVDDSTEIDGITYTFDGENWTFVDDDGATQVAPEDVVNQIVAESYSPDAGDVQTLDDIDYTFDGDNWLFNAISDNQDDITAAYQNEQAPLEADTQYTDENGTDYTYDGDNWTYIGTETATEDIANQIVAEYYAPNEGDSQDIDDITYVYTDGAWTYETDTTTIEIADEDTANQILAAYYVPLEGDSYELNDITYTFDGDNWNFESTETTTETADEDVASQILAANYTPAADDSVELDGITYTFDGENWASESEEPVTETADEDTVNQIVAQYYTASDGDTAQIDDTTYTLTDGNWIYDTTTTQTASAEIAEQLANYYAASDGDTVRVDDTTYTFAGGEWSYTGAEPTITSYYQFSASVSSADAPVVIQTATTAGALEHTSLSAPAVIAGNGSDFAIDGVGTISGLDADELLTLSASGSELSALALSGDIDIASSGKNFSHTLNGAALNYSSADKGAVVSFTATPDVVLAQSAAAVTLKSIDDKQEWILNSSSDNALTFGKVAYTAQGDVAVSAADDSASYLSASLDDGESIILSKNGSNRSDSLSVNGVLIASAAKAGGDTSSTISAFDDDLVVIAGTNGGTLSVNGSNLDLADGARATITGSGSDAAITAVDTLDSNGKWVLGADDVTLAGTQHWTASSSVTLIADSAGTGISRVNFASGTVALNAVDTAAVFAADSININGKAAWGFSGTDDSFDAIAPFIAFDSDGAATLSNDDRYSATVTLSSGKGISFTAATTGDVLTLSKGDAVTVYGEDSVAANSIAAGGNWSVAADTVALGGYTLAGGAGAVITANKSAGDVIHSIANLSADATLTYSGTSPINGLTVGDTTWTIKGASVDDDASVSAVVFNVNGGVTVTAGDSALDI